MSVKDYLFFEKEKFPLRCLDIAYELFVGSWCLARRLVLG